VSRTRSLPAIFAAGLLLLGVAGCAHSPDTARDTPLMDAKADAQQRADIRMHLASAYYTEGQFSVALQELDKALRIDPERADVHGLRALVLMQAGDNQQAWQSFRKAMSLEPGNPGLQNNTGWFLCQTGRAAEAMPHFERAIADKTYAAPEKALLNAGLCKMRNGDAAAAETYLLRAVEAEPRNMQAHASLAQIFYNRADYSLARRHILLALQSEQAVADNLLMAIRIERKLGDRAAVQSLASQMHRQFPDSPQAGASLRGEPDE
jgi:type IV pilus assembly protein PilF